MAGRLPRNRGFTLVEVLVALVVMATLALMAWQGVDGIVRTRDASQARMESTLRLGTVLAQWEQDLASLQETDAVPALTFDGATLRLTRRTDDGIQLVAWSLQPTTGASSDEAVGNQWLRWTGPSVTSSGPLQDSWLRSQALQGNPAGASRTLSGISQWQVYCYRGNAWSNCQSSGDLGASGGANPTKTVLPSGLRLVLTFAGGQGFDGTLTRDVAFGPQSP
ncbi:MAG: prepilin-type N-terminal cleavage/methylation domain-containing protein [Burkholderiaceae bacterium]|nr:prepilin-type N-terminal cleavage/methylation domain-containing protein [Burkholderiaceae bacterium]